MPPTHSTEGLDAAKAIKAEHPSIGVLVLSAHIETHFALELLEAGTTGAGYLLKERVTDIDEVTDALRGVAMGGLVLDPSVVALLIGRRRAHNPLDDLTERERDVLSVMAEGGQPGDLRAFAPEPEDRRGLRAWRLHQTRPLSAGGRQPPGAGRAHLPPRLSLHFTGRPSGGGRFGGPVWRHARPRRACWVEWALQGDCSMG